ncbi:hypothetical protein I4U23_003115 [Adineta vaga]|nr:hypothetical protein I4U23_003115 [Adineta vaga]
MAQSINHNITVPSLSFHQRTYGQHIRLDKNGSTANRHTSFDHGVTFTNRQIKKNERIHMKIVDIDETGQWLGSLAIGFTQIDPNSIRKEDLCKSALPNLCQKDGISYMKRICDKLTREIIITFYYNQDGGFYILDGREQELCKNIDVSEPLWAVIDVYGNVKGVSFTSAPKITDGSKSFFTKYHQKPDQLPITYFSHLKSSNLQPIAFRHIHGVELELFCQNKVAFRKNVQRLAQPYVFIDLPMTTGDELYIRILSIDVNYRTPGVIGFTNADPSIFTENFHKFLTSDPMALCDRPEYWIIVEDAFDEKSNELDEYCFKFDKEGCIQMQRNNDLRSNKAIAFADSSQTFYPFFFLNGRISAFALIGLISSSNKTLPKKDEDANSGLCQICLDAEANCVFIPCGHIFFCSDCKDSCAEKLAENRCPICRKVYTDIFQIADD